MIGSLHICMVLCLAAGEAPSSHDFVRVERLSERVAVGYWLGAGRTNVVAIKGQNGLAIVDTELSPRIMAPIKAEFEKAFGRNDWVYVVNTHAHMHHAGGNGLFEDANVVGHDNLPAEMEWLARMQANEGWKCRALNAQRETLRGLRAALPRFARRPVEARRVRGTIRFYELHIKDLEEGFDVVKPTVTFADQHTLDLGDLTLELVHFGKGHSASDILIHVPQENLLITGGILPERGHLPGVAEQAELADVWRHVDVLSALMAREEKINHVVPSHGPLVRRGDLLRLRNYYRTTLRGIQAAQRKGLSLAQTQWNLAVHKRFRAYHRRRTAWWSRARHNRNIQILWRLLEEAVEY